MGRTLGAKGHGHHTRRYFTASRADGTERDDWLARGYDARLAGQSRDLYKRKGLTAGQRQQLKEYQEGWDAADVDVKQAEKNEAFARRSRGEG